MDSLDIEQQLSADQRRGRYVRVSDTDRRQLIDAYKKNEDFIALAKKLNIKRSTARSILRTFIDEGRVSAKQRAGTRLRFITEDEAEIIRDMKRRHPLITIGQIQMRLQRTSNRVLSKASISRILTNSIRLGKRAKQSSLNGNGDDGDDFSNKNMSGHDEMGQISSDEGTEGMFYIDEDEDEDDDEDDDPTEESNGKPGTMQNLEDFQRFMLRKTSINGDDSTNNQEHYEHNDAPIYENNYPINYPNFNSDGEDEELSELDENESKSPTDAPNGGTSANCKIGDTSTSNETGAWNGNQSSVKTEPVCVFLNQNYDSSDSEAPCTVADRVAKPLANSAPTNNVTRRIKICPICGEKNFFKLSHHLTVVHNMNRNESLAVIAHAGRKFANPSGQSMVASASGSSPKRIASSDLDKSPQPTPISITTNNQQITGTSSPPLGAIESETNSITQNNDHIPTNYSSADGKKRLLCPQCETWVLNLTDHLIKKHHLLSKQDRLPFLRLARTRQNPGTNEKLSTSSFIIPSEQNNELQKSIHLLQADAIGNDRKYQHIVKKFRKSGINNNQASSSTHNSAVPTTNGEHSSSPSNQNPLSINTTSTLLNNNVSPSERACQSIKRRLSSTKTNGIPSTTKDIQQIAIHQKFEQRLSVFRQQFAVTVAIQNSLMQQMELLQRSFVSIEDEWNDMRASTDASFS